MSTSWLQFLRDYHRAVYDWLDDDTEYPLDPRMVNEWIRSMPVDVKGQARRIVAAVEYVTKVKFVRAFEEMAARVDAAVGKHNPMILMNDVQTDGNGNARSNNFFATLYAQLVRPRDAADYLRSQSGSMGNLDGVYSRDVVYCDDASYSGSQLCAFLQWTARRNHFPLDPSGNVIVNLADSKSVNVANVDFEEVGTLAEHQRLILSFDRLLYSAMLRESFLGVIVTRHGIRRFAAYDVMRTAVRDDISRATASLQFMSLAEAPEALRSVLVRKLRITTHSVERVRLMRRTPRLRIHLCIPFMTEKALAAVASTVSGMCQPRDGVRVVVYAMTPSVKKVMRSTHWEYEYLVGLGPIVNVSKSLDETPMVYFQHKVADSASTAVNPMLIYGIYPSAVNAEEELYTYRAVGSLLKNCAAPPPFVRARCDMERNWSFSASESGDDWTPVDDDISMILGHKAPCPPVPYRMTRPRVQ